MPLSTPSAPSRDDPGRGDVGDQRPLIPLWLKISWTAFVLVLIPVWWVHHGPVNFLWFSDIALFGLTIALWMESRLIASTMAVAVLIPEIAWNVDYAAGLALGEAPLGLAGHMFDDAKPRWLRAMSLFHVPLLAALIWLPWRLGYDPRALPLQTAIAWIVLPATWLATTPDRNINWVWGFPPSPPQQIMHPLLYLALLMILFPLCLYVPHHFLLRWLLGSRDPAQRAGSGVSAPGSGQEPRPNAGP